MSNIPDTVGLVLLNADPPHLSSLGLMTNQLVTIMILEFTNCSMSVCVHSPLSTAHLLQ